MSVLGLHCCLGFSLAVVNRGYFLVAVHGLLIAVASPDAEHRLSGMGASVVGAPGLWSAGSIVVTHGLSCSTASGIFPDRGLNPCLLHWQVGSLPLSHHGSPLQLFFKSDYFPTLPNLSTIFKICKFDF